uniref:Activating transcription factor 2 n=1 Tax=Equus caballus TaxID=9796 RepID=F7B0R5_HORSE
MKFKLRVNSARQYKDLWNMSDDKPFLCTAPGCGQRFTNEDHLAVHKHKHEMTLKFGPARNDSVIVADQTPTPTRFLKNCEEVGLFNELASPFENEFKKASEDDIKKMPLDLSPLATPIIRSKIEEPSVVETTHQDSPLPHPESTTSDEKEVPLVQTAQPTSAIVRPASLQVPNVLLTSSDSSVIIQQAVPSPTSSTVITQAPSSNRPIVLLQLTQLHRPKIQVVVEEEQLMKILMKKGGSFWSEIEQQLQDADKKGKSGFSL